MYLLHNSKNVFCLFTFPCKLKLMLSEKMAKRNDKKWKNWNKLSENKLDADRETYAHWAVEIEVNARKRGAKKECGSAKKNKREKSGSEARKKKGPNS